MDIVDTRPISLESFLAIQRHRNRREQRLVYLQKGHLLVFSVIVLWFPYSGLL